MKTVDEEVRISQCEEIEDRVPSRECQADEALDQEMEAMADELLRRVRSKEFPIYTDRSLARKMRLEAARRPEVEETDMPAVAIDYLLRRQVRLLADSARLTKLQAAALALTLDGWELMEISERFGLAYRTVRRALTIARARITCGGSPYDGLYEVYWSEVHRYVYRKGGR